MRPAALVELSDLAAEFVQYLARQGDSRARWKRLRPARVLRQMLRILDLLGEQIPLAGQSKASAMPNCDWPRRGQKAIEKRVAVLPGPQAGRAAKEVGGGVPNRAGAKTLVDAVL